MEIRYTKRICTDTERIHTFLEQSRVGIVSMEAGEYPYAVPVNYVMMNECVYFHSAGSGKKTDILAQTPKVCFTVFEEIGTETNPVPCHVDTAYMSVMIMGTAGRVEDTNEATAALQRLLDKYLPGIFKQPLSPALVEKYRSSMDTKATAVFKIRPDILTAKENRVAPELLFGAHADSQ
ncbi:MAG TPA: pyridoxamine 5'-phosphate oxidase family protein [Syntrophomonas sp.]|nr:pyridoxamine 5'-phosphate oxidase family protein [Syntrophomonas sp.]